MTPKKERYKFSFLLEDGTLLEGAIFCLDLKILLLTKGQNLAKIAIKTKGKQLIIMANMEPLSLPITGARGENQKEEKGKIKILL